MRCATLAGVRNMPLPIVEPTRTATALHRPRRRSNRSPQRSAGIRGADMEFANYTLTLLARGAYSRNAFGSSEGVLMPHFRALARLAALSALAVGCKTSQAYDRSNDPGGKPLGSTTVGSLILTGRSLSIDPGR